MASLEPKSGILGKRLAAHLLRRTTFKITPSRIADFAAKTPDQAITELFTFPDYDEWRGPISTSGTFWLTVDPFDTANWSEPRKNAAVLLWYHNETLKDISIRHKMALFLKTNFVTEYMTYYNWHKFEYERLCQYFALGNMKTFAYKMTLDNQMLTFLDNKLNKKGQPNENYAREFLELFTIQKGPQIEIGNYTNYTEQDVQQAARVLTGFTTDNFSNKDSDTGFATGQAKYGDHDVGNKQFSSAFQNKVILGATSESDMYRELQDFIDMVFDQMETARAYIRKMYIYFVHDAITDEIENDIIEPLAQDLFSNGYELQPVLSTLLKSKHFYDEDDSDHTDNIIGGKIKPPLELLFQSANLFDADKMTGPFESNLENRNYNAAFTWNTLRICGYSPYPNTVEGYPGFYKAPGFSNNWVNTTFLIVRHAFEQAVRRGRNPGNSYTPYLKIDNMTSYFDTHYTNQEYADIFLTQIMENLLPEIPDTDRFNYFKNILLGGLSEINWMFEWQSYKETGDDSAVGIVLLNLYIAIFKSPEFQTY